MFDKASEIINLLNIMRLNDGRSELNVADYFDNDRKFDKLKWLGASVGDTYRVRGGDPDISLSPSVSTGKTASSWPKRTLDGSVMKAPTRDDRACKPDASELQEAVMLKTVQEGGINESDDDLSVDRYLRLYILATVRV
jgi:hypothetical protein